MDNLSEEEKTSSGRPTPDDFDTYLPWACQLLRVDANVVVNKISYVTPSNQKLKKSQIAKSKYEIGDSDIVSIQSLDGQKQVARPENLVKIGAVYDISGNLLQLKFDNKNTQVPPELIKLIRLIIHYHKFMASITINAGLNNQCLYEINKLIELANITDVCLDNTAVCGGRYDVILQNRNTLKHLSISRCDIDDSVVKRIAASLEYPLPASKTLLGLKMTSNCITDEGAKYIGCALRSNRQLAYLNLAGNKITDEGAKHIFEILSIFPVTEEEVIATRHRKMQFIKERNCLIDDIAQELKCADLQRRFSKKKSIKPNSVPSNNSSKKGNDRDVLRNTGDRSVTDLDAIWIDKAQTIANERMGQFKEPYSDQNVFFKNDQFYCYGNNSITYINISYNNVSYITLKMILLVLIEQRNQNRIPKGLINVSIEGNALPSKCKELEQIDYILLSNLPTEKPKKN